MNSFPLLPEQTLRLLFYTQKWFESKNQFILHSSNAKKCKKISCSVDFLCPIAYNRDAGGLSSLYTRITEREFKRYVLSPDAGAYLLFSKDSRHATSPAEETER